MVKAQPRRMKMWRNKGCPVKDTIVSRSSGCCNNLKKRKNPSQQRDTIYSPEYMATHLNAQALMNVARETFDLFLGTPLTRQIQPFPRITTRNSKVHRTFCLGDSLPASSWPGDLVRYTFICSALEGLFFSKPCSISEKNPQTNINQRTIVQCHLNSQH